MSAGSSRISAAFLLLVYLFLGLCVEIPSTAVMHLDRSVLLSLNGFGGRHTGLTSFWRVVSTVGQPAVWRVAAAVVAFGYTRRRRYFEALFVLVAVGGSAVLASVSKVAVGRPRPTPPDVLAHATGASFPSGHACAAVSVAATMTVLVLASRSRKYCYCLVILWPAAALVAFSRIALGVHYLSDVIAGTALGAGWVLLFVRLTRPASGVDDGSAAHP